MIIKTTSSKLYRKVTEIHHYKPTPAEMHLYYGGTHAGINPNNPYSKRQYSTKTYFKEVKS